MGNEELKKGMDAREAGVNDGLYNVGRSYLLLGEVPRTSPENVSWDVTIPNTYGVT